MAESSTFRATSFSSSFLQTVTDLAAGDILAHAASGLVTEKVISTGGVVDPHEGQRLDIGGAAQVVADGDVGQTGEATMSPAVMLSQG